MDEKFVKFKFVPHGVPLPEELEPGALCFEADKGLIIVNHVNYTGRYAAPGENGAEVGAMERRAEEGPAG